MRIYEIILVLFVHWVADFVLQTAWEAENKSKSNQALLQHVSKYSVCWVAPMSFIFYSYGFNLIGSIFIAILFAMITFITHTTIDYFTSRLNARLWNSKKTHDFFVSVGWDQFMHFVQLFLTFNLIKNI